MLPGGQLLAHRFTDLRLRPRVGLLDATLIPKYQTSLLIPPAMPAAPLNNLAARNTDYYEISLRQFRQHILPPSMLLPRTRVMSYGAANFPETFQYPACTIEAKYNRPVRVKWINELVDAAGNYLPHFLPIDQTLHWANPPGGAASDSRGSDPTPYAGPIPMVTHLHGVHATQENDGFPEAWFLPNARNIPPGYAPAGGKYREFAAEFQAKWGQAWERGTSIYQYPNDQRATTLWYHDHTLGMTRINVYAGTAGFYLLRGGPDDRVFDARARGRLATLPGPAPAIGDAPGTEYFEIPLVIQDRTFNADGSLFFPDNRAFFEGLTPAQLQIPFIPQEACGGKSDISPLWNPEFFGTTMVVNGRTWPFLNVQARRYRLRILNGCNARTMILRLQGNQPMPFWRIGADGGFLPAPVQQSDLLLAPAERADVILDFTGLAGKIIQMTNVGPDSPFGGGQPVVDFPPSDPGTTGQVMQFRVGFATSRDASTPPAALVLPAITDLGVPGYRRQVSLNELESSTVRFVTDAFGNVVPDCGGAPFGPEIGLLGTVAPDGTAMPMMWDDPVTETPIVGQTELWEIYNFTEDAHPIHLHQTMFQVVEREPMPSGVKRGPDDGETGFKDTVIAYPGEITRIKIRFDLKGLHVWHCHIIDHEDNEMMRPLLVR